MKAPIPLPNTRIFQLLRRTGVFSAAALALGATFLFTPPALAAAPKQRLNTADTRFIQTEAASGAAMVKMASLAEKKAQHKEVRAWAGAIASEHAKSNAQLASLAARKGIELPQESSSKPDGRHEADYEALKKADSADFDKKFLTSIINRHEACVDQYEEAAVESRDSDVQAWAAKTLPALKVHLEKAKKLNSLVLAKESNLYPGASGNQADNTSRNTRDRGQDTLTPLDQGNSQSDTDTTAQIRKAITDRKGLSINAQNVKIITDNGHVTLRGPVDSSEEKRIIGDIGKRIAQPAHVDNQIEVRSSSASK